MVHVVRDPNSSKFSRTPKKGGTHYFKHENRASSEDYDLGFCMRRIKCHVLTIELILSRTQRWRKKKNNLTLFSARTDRIGTNVKDTANQNAYPSRYLAFYTTYELKKFRGICSKHGHGEEQCHTITNER